MITGYLVVLIFVWVWLETKNNDLVDCLWGWVWEEIMAWLAVAKTRWGIVLSTACFCIFLLCPQKLDNLCPDFPVWCQVGMKEGVKWQAHFLLVEAGGKVSGLRELQHQISADRGQAGMDLEHTKVRGSQSWKRTSKNTQNGDDQETEKMRNAINWQKYIWVESDLWLFVFYY